MKEEEKKEGKKKEEARGGILVSLKDVYTAKDSLNLYAINKERTKIKHVLTKEVKRLEGEVSLLSVLDGSIKTEIDEKVLADLRLYFKMVMQVGYSDGTRYDFFRKQDAGKLYKIILFEDIQRSHDSSNDFLDF